MTVNKSSSILRHSEIDLLIRTAGDEFSCNNLDKAQELCEKAIELTVTHNYLVGKGDALILKGKILYRLVKYDDAFEVFHQVLDIFQEVGDAHKISIAVQGIGSVYYANGRLLEALEEFLNAYAILELAGHEEETLRILGNIVIIYHTLSEYSLAIQYSEKQLSLAKKYNFEDHTAKALSNLGELYFRLSDFTTSLNYSTEGLSVAEHCGDKAAESSILANISSVYFHLGNYTGALDFTMRSIALADQIGRKRLLPSLCNYACCIYGKLNNDSLALSYAMRALEIYTSFEDPIGEAYSLHNIASIFEQNGDIQTALEYALKSYQLFHASSVKDGESETLLLIASCNEKMGLHQEAFNYAKQALDIAEAIDSYSLLISSLKQIVSYCTLIGDSTSASHFAQRLNKTSKLIAKQEQRKNAEKLLLDVQIQKTRQKAEQLLRLSSSTLTGEFLAITHTLKHQGFVLTTVIPPETVKKPKSSPIISVQTFGHFSVNIGNRELTSEDWQRKKARDIFKILLMNHRKSISAEELIDILWLNAAGKNLIPTLWNCVSYIRKALEPTIKPRQPSAYIKIVGKNYMLDLGADAKIDFLTFREIVTKAHKQSTIKTQIEMYEQAIEMYKGEFLKEDTFEDWSSFERESLKEQYLNILTFVGKYYLELNNTTQSILYARKILEIDKVQDDGYEILFKSLKSSGYISELTKSWTFCKASYRREFLSLPPKHLSILVGEI
ncbi:MAG: tetratricopeptide repeat protein [Ignavibacteria bacterium]|nr:tetratricopeptide repeat protein [Ignavibacteria bacterium]